MQHLSSVLVEHSNPQWAYHEAAVCHELEWRHEEVLSPGNPAHRLGCLLVADDTIFAHVKYHNASTAIAWVDAATAGMDLVKGAAYYIDTMTYNHHLYSMKNKKISLRHSAYEWDVLSVSQPRLLFIRDFNLEHSHRKRSLHDLIDAEHSRVRDLV